MPPILLLHLSDLHFGPHSRFQGDKPEKLGKSFHRSLAEAQKRLPIDAKKEVDLVFVTGDFAEAGKKVEFAQGRAFLEGLAGELGLLPQKFVFVPGNHDVNWDACRAAFYTAQMDGEPTEAQIRAALDGAKFKFYDEFLANFYGKHDPREPIERGAFLYRFEELQLAVAALNSCEKESHRASDHVGEVSEVQAQAVLDALRGPDLKGWFKVLAVHHNPVGTTPANLGALLHELEKGAEDQRLVWLKMLASATSAGTTDEAKLELWRNTLAERAFDPHLFGRFVSDAFGFDGRRRLKSIVEDARPQLILHGHHHAKDEDALRWKANGFAHVLSAGSLWLRPDKLPENEPASARLILLDPEVPEIRAWSLVFSERARNEGEVGFGAFTLDAAEPDGYQQQLDLPKGFELRPQRKRSAKKEESSVDTEFLTTFRLRFTTLFSSWDVGSLGALRPGGIRGTQDATLDEMYLELRFDPNFSPEEVDRGEPLFSENLLRRNRPLLIQGVAGSGKTTWMRYTFNRLVDDLNAFPLMIVLRDVAKRWDPDCRGRDRSIDSLLEDWVSSHMGGAWTGHLSTLLKQDHGPRPILLIDGWDELGPLGEEFRGKLMGFLREHPRMLTVVSSRPYGGKKPSNSDGFDELAIQPLSEGDIGKMTRAFFQRFSTAGPETVERDVKKFLQALERTPEAADLARTAMLLTLMLLVGHSQPLPDKRHNLYQKCIDALLEARPKTKASEGALASRHAWAPSNIDQRRRWVAFLAHAVQTEGYKDSPRASIVRSREDMEHLLPPECPAEKRHSFLTWLVEVAGLLVERTDGSLSFTHLSFQEYLVALHLATNAADHEQRFSAIQCRVGWGHWWETLRLLAAQMDGSNPEFLEIALRALIDDKVTGDERLSFLGTILADGLGSDLLFQDWCKKFLALVPNAPRLMFGCAQAWLASHQQNRKTIVSDIVIGQSRTQSWIGWLRYKIFGSGWIPEGEIPKGATSRAILASLATKPEISQEHIAAGRILVGSFPLWPSVSEVGWLHLWPSHRRIAGLRLQSAAASGAPHKWLVALAQKTMPLPIENEEFRQNVKNVASRLASYWSTVHEPRWSPDWPIEWFQHWAYDWARYWAADWARDIASKVDPSLVAWASHDLAIYWSHQWAKIGFDQWPHHWASDSARGLANGFSTELARAWAEKLKTDPDSPWLQTFGITEIHSFGRSAARAHLARVQDIKEPGLQLLAKACRFSFDMRHRADLTVNPTKFSGLWPALARHIARMSSPEDRAFLENLVVTGGKELPEPLNWGIQFVVRGDILLDDGSVVTLDELADEAGVPHLPYIEEMAPQLEVDWSLKHGHIEPSPHFWHGPGVW